MTKKSYYDVVIAGHKTDIVDIAVDQSFHNTFGSAVYFKRLRDVGSVRLTIFSARAEKIAKQDIASFENLLIEDGHTILYSGFMRGESGIVRAYFFNFKIPNGKFDDIRDLLIEKIEEVIGKKVDYHDGLYYFYLSPLQAASKKLVKNLRDILDLSIIENFKI